MEDNNYEHGNYEKCFLCKHPIAKYVMIGLLIFFGAFAAFYVVADWHFKRMLDPLLQIQKMDKAMMRQERQMDKFAQKEFAKEHQMMQNTAPFIHVDKADNAYKIIIDLRPFDNNEKNIEVKTNGNMVTINAAGEKNSHKGQEITRYSQTFAFGEKINSDEITKVRQNNEYIITIPFID